MREEKERRREEKETKNQKALNRAIQFIKPLEIEGFEISQDSFGNKHSQFHLRFNGNSYLIRLAGYSVVMSYGGLFSFKKRFKVDEKLPVKIRSVVSRHITQEVVES